MIDNPPLDTGNEPAADVARRVAMELFRLRMLTSRIEFAVSGLMSDIAGVTSGNHRDLQSLDSLGQMLEGLAEFINATANQMSADWHIDPAPAALDLKLRDLATRLATPDGSAAEAQAEEPYDCDFF